MSSLSALEVLAVVNREGVQVQLNGELGLDVFPASKILPSHLKMLKVEKSLLLEHLCRQAALKLGITIKDGDALFVAYHSHHFQCQQCIAAGLGYGRRCPIGQPLWYPYQLVSYLNA